MIRSLWLLLRLMAVLLWESFRHPHSWSRITVESDGRIRVERFATRSEANAAGRLR